MGITGRKRIVILGGGFGGLYAALRLEKTLARDPDVEILLVNRENFFLFTPMLHEVAASDLDLTHIVNPVRKLLKRVQFFDGDVDDIDLPGKSVLVAHGAEHHAHELEYDHLVIALGSITNFFNLPGLEERALTMKSLGDAIYLRNKLISHLEEADFECCATRTAGTTDLCGRRRRVFWCGDHRLAQRFRARGAQILSQPARGVSARGAGAPRSGDLTELGENLGAYAQRKLAVRQVEIKVNTRVTGVSERASS